MQFLENIKEFFNLATQNGFNIAKIFEQAPNSVYSTGSVVLVLLLIIVFFIIRASKASSTLKLVSQIHQTNDLNSYNDGLNKLANELPKRGVKVAQKLNDQKSEILKKELELLKDLNISQKIDKLQEMSKQYALISKNSQKYSIDGLSSYYEQTSKDLLDINLFDEIDNYSENAVFNENEVSNVNNIVSYSNSKDNKDEILKLLTKNINRLSYSHNLELYKFIKALSKDKSGGIYTNCTEKLNECFNDENQKISDTLLKYILESEDKENAYSYISNLANNTYLQDLYYKLFAKTEDINLDLAFIANKTNIEEEYKKHIDYKITDNWKDKSYIKFIIESENVLETIGHIDYRNVLERIEKLDHEEEQNKAISEALKIARRAESIANEAKAMASHK